MSRKKVLVIVSLALLLLGLGVLPATADAPVTFTSSTTFSDPNPCTGLQHELTINLEFREHQGHSRNFVGHIKRTGTTDSGYVMEHGVETFVVNNNILRGSLADIWHHPDGSKFIARGAYVLDLSTGELLVNTGSLQCLGN